MKTVQRLKMLGDEYIEVTNSLVENNYLCVLGTTFVLIFIVRDLVIRVKRVEMMHHYKART